MTMSPVDRLEAAVELLERMSVDGSDGAWYADWLTGGPALGWRAGVFNGVERIALCQERDAHLIATLHRTIDAQLAILRRALPKASAKYAADAEGFHLSHLFEEELALADAILGSDS